MSQAYCARGLEGSERGILRRRAHLTKRYEEGPGFVSDLDLIISHRVMYDPW